jgi:nicotinamidase/pyrazinamidase
MASKGHPVRTALVVVDVQNDFCEGGVLAARDTGTLIAPLNAAIAECAEMSIPSIFTRDWHPADHSSFQNHGGPWPVHCVQGTIGADFAVGLVVPKGSQVVDKGIQYADDGYSMFGATNLKDILAELRVEGLAVCGIATEYCVLESVRDARRLGYSVAVLEDLIRPVELHRGDGRLALAEMTALGAHLDTGATWMEKLKL